MTLTQLTRKEWILGILMSVYLGGFAYYWGMISGDLYLIVVLSFLTTHFIGNRITLEFIYEGIHSYRISHRIPRIIADFVVNLVIAYSVIPVMDLLHNGPRNEFLLGPALYGLCFGICYFIYLTLSLKDGQSVDHHR